MSTSTTAAALLAKGIRKVDIAEHLGLTPSAVTQAVASAPAAQLTDQHVQLDNQYDRIEQGLLNQLEKTMPLLMRPMEIAKVLSTINGARRRGGPLKDSGPKTVVQLNLPVAIQNRFVLNAQNQVVSAGNQDLVTLQSQNVVKLLESSKNASPQEDEFGFPVAPSTR